MGVRHLGRHRLDREQSVAGLRSASRDGVGPRRLGPRGRVAEVDGRGPFRPGEAGRWPRPPGTSHQRRERFGSGCRETPRKQGRLHPNRVQWAAHGSGPNRSVWDRSGAIREQPAPEIAGGHPSGWMGAVGATNARPCLQNPPRPVSLLCGGLTPFRREGILQEGGPMGMGPFQAASNSTYVPIQ